MSALSHILASSPEEPDSTGEKASNSASVPKLESMPSAVKSQPAQEQADEQAADTPKTDAAAGEENTSPNEPMYTSTTTSTRRNASGSVSSVYSGNKIKHLKKEDGIPLWRKDIQYEFLNAVFTDQNKCFTKYSDGTKDHTFAEVYIDAMAKSSKCSKILKEKLLQDQEGAMSMAMVCLLVNVGRMNTTLNFFPEMRAQLRTYHSIPALQAHQDPNAYKQLQDAPRLKSILKGATEDEPQPSTVEEVKAASIPRTNPVNLIFVMSQYAPKISEVHFEPPRDFFDLVMRASLSSASRARAFLWLVWWYLESDFSYEDSQRNPFGPGQYGEGDKDSGVLPLKVPPLEGLTEDEAAAENVDTEDEKHYGEVKRKERISILASEPSPAMTALKRARKEKGLTSGNAGQMHSDDEASEVGWSKTHITPAGRSSALNHETGSEYTRSPSPAASRGFQAVNTKPAGDMRINNLLNNDDAMSEASPPQSGPISVASHVLKKGPGRGNWRRSKSKQEASGPLSARPQDDRSHPVPLLPNTGQINFVNDAPTQLQPTTPTGHHSLTSSNAFLPGTSAALAFQTYGMLDHVPTPSYQAQKRNRGVTQHQSAVMSHRKQQIDYTLDRRIRKVHRHARGKREDEGSILRAWKRIRFMPTDYDSEEEAIKIRKAKDRADKEEDWRPQHRGKENVESYEDVELWRRPRVLMAGFFRMPGEQSDVGEEARSLARSFRRCARRLERWQDTNYPGEAMIRRRASLGQRFLHQPRARTLVSKELSMDLDGLEMMLGEPRGDVRRQWSGTGRISDRRSEGTRDEQKMDVEPDDEDGGGELDEEDRELLGEVDADESEDDEDEDMGDD